MWFDTRCDINFSWVSLRAPFAVFFRPELRFVFALLIFMRNLFRARHSICCELTRVPRPQRCHILQTCKDGFRCDVGDALAARIAFLDRHVRASNSDFDVWT